MARRPKTDQRTAQRARIVLDCASGLSQHRRGGQTFGDDPDRGQVAGTVPDGTFWSLGGRTPLGPAPQDHRPEGGRRDHPDAGDAPQERHPLEYPDHGRGQRAQSKCHCPDLARLRAEASLTGELKLSTDPFLVEKVRDIVGLYMNPPESTRAVVMCVDEKSQVQALDRSQPVLPMRPGQAERRPMITTVTEPPPCLRRWTWPPARSSVAVTDGIGTRSSSDFWNRLSERSRPG